MTAAVIVLLVAALLWALHELQCAKHRIREQDSLIRSLNAEVCRLNPSHPNCRCHILPVAETQNATLVGYGIPHKVLEGGVCEISIADLDRSKSWPARARHDFDVVEYPEKPGRIYVTEKERRPASVDPRSAPKGFRWASENELEPLAAVDAAFLRQAQGARFRDTTLPSGAVTPPYDMIANGGMLERIR